MKTRTFLTAALLAATQSAFAFQYSVTNLGTLGGNGSVAKDLNDSGQVVGYSYIAGDNFYHPFLYSNGTMTDLGSMGGPYSIATGINASGQIVGNSTMYGGISHPFLYSSGTMTDLVTRVGYNSYVNGINDSGQIVGTASRAFIYSLDSNGMTDLGSMGPSRDSTSYGWGINASGQVVGFSVTPTVSSHAFTYSNGTMTDLGTLGGSGSAATGINDSGQVVGYSDTSGDKALHPFLYSDGTMTDLGTLGGTWSVAWDINASGQVVGQSRLPGETGPHGFLYSDGAMVDLNSLIDPQSGWTILDANAINTRGDIAAYGVNSAGEMRALLLTDPVPVPAPMPILGAVAAVGWSRKLRRRIKDAQAQEA